jgi:hypothetical protein
MPLRNQNAKPLKTRQLRAYYVWRSCSRNCACALASRASNGKRNGKSHARAALSYMAFIFSPLLPPLETIWAGDHPAPCICRRCCMLPDIVMLVLGTAFFALAMGYTIACARL